MSRSLVIRLATVSRSPRDMPAKGSSIRMILGSRARPMAMSSARWKPCASAPAFTLSRPVRPTRARMSFASASTASSVAAERNSDRFRPRRERIASATFSITGRSLKIEVRWKVLAMPIRARRSGVQPVISAPLKATRPESGASAPVTRLKRVVLPAPLGPMIEWIVRSRIVVTTSSTAFSPRKRRERPRISSVMVGLPGRAAGRRGCRPLRTGRPALRSR